MKAEKPVEWLKNTRGPASCSREKVGEIIPPGISRRTRELHRQLLGYRMSPLKGLDRLSALLGLGNIWVKDESQRLTLNSFKVLGGTFAIYNYLKQRLGIEGEDLPFSELTLPRMARKLGDITFAAATDGNHGRGVAWAAGRIGRPAVIYVHKETSPSRIRAIEGYGARVVVVDGTYDDAVRRIREDALKNDWQIIEDTSWEGYEEIPIWVMQGYTTMFRGSGAVVRSGLHQTYPHLRPGWGRLIGRFSDRILQGPLRPGSSGFDCDRAGPGGRYLRIRPDRGRQAPSLRG